MPDTCKLADKKTTTPTAVLKLSEVNGLREIFRHWTPESDPGFPSVPVGSSENCPGESRHSAWPDSLPDKFGYIIDEEALTAMESLARGEGGYNPKLVSVAKLRQLLHRGQRPVTQLVNAWKLHHAGLSDEHTSKVSVLAVPHPEPSLVCPQNRSKLSDSDSRDAAQVFAEAQAVVGGNRAARAETLDRLAMLLPFDTPTDEAARRRAFERAKFSAFAAAYVHIVRRPAGAAEIYDGATLVYRPALSRGYARRALELSAPPGLEKLRNGLFWLRRRPVPANPTPFFRYHSRQPLDPDGSLRGEKTPAQLRSERNKFRHELFSGFAVEHLTRIGRPAGPTEIYDAAVDVQLNLDFRRRNARIVLARARNPRLCKLKDGAYWLADRKHVPRHTRGRYWSRRRQMDYHALGRELVEILTARRCALRAFELRARLSEAMRAALPAHHPSIPFTKATRHYPQLRRDKGWWSLVCVDETRPRGLSLDQETAVYAIDICSLRGPSSTHEIAAMLPKYLRALVNVAEVLPRVAPSFAALVCSGEKWSVNPNRPVFVHHD
jgi:hypothetical protein